MTTTYDPKADYEVVKGAVTIKDPKTNNRRVLRAGDVTKLDHLEPHQIAFLVERKRVYKVATAAAAAKAAKAEEKAKAEAKGGEG